MLEQPLALSVHVHLIEYTGALLDLWATLVAPWPTSTVKDLLTSTTTSYARTALAAMRSYTASGPARGSQTTASSDSRSSSSKVTSSSHGKGYQEAYKRSSAIALDSILGSLAAIMRLIRDQVHFIMKTTIPEAVGAMQQLTAQHHAGMGFAAAPEVQTLLLAGVCFAAKHCFDQSQGRSPIRADAAAAGSSKRAAKAVKQQRLQPELSQQAGSERIVVPKHHVAMMQALGISGFAVGSLMRSGLQDDDSLCGAVLQM